MWETLKNSLEKKLSKYKEMLEEEDDQDQIHFLNGKIWTIGETLEEMEDIEKSIPSPQPKNPITLKEFYDGCIDRGATPESEVLIEYCNPRYPTVKDGRIFID